MLRLASGALALLLLLAAPRALRAQPAELTRARAEQLAHHAERLLAGDRGVRAEALRALTQVGRDYLPAISARLEQALPARPSRDEVVRVLDALRSASLTPTGADEPDLASGVAAMLANERTPGVVAVIERLLYLRAPEAMDDEQADLASAHWVTLDAGAWQDELLRFGKRRGVRLLPALLLLRAHPNAELRRFAADQLATLGMSDPNAALALADPYLLARTIRAYTNPLDYAALPGIVRLVSAARASVRDAARAGVARYGKNAIWQLRQLYEEQSGHAADRSWDAERTASELYARLDRVQLADADSLLARGTAHLHANELPEMLAAYDLLLTKYPQFSGRAKLAAGYAAVGAEKLAHDDLAGALAAYRRALWLDAAAEQSRMWRARIEYAAAELTLTHGVADIAGYDRALDFDPQLRAARHAREILTGEHGRRMRELKRAAAAGSLLVFSVLAVLLLLAARKPKLTATTPG